MKGVAARNNPLTQKQTFTTDDKPLGGGLYDITHFHKHADHHVGLQFTNSLKPHHLDLLKQAAYKHLGYTTDNHYAEIEDHLHNAIQEGGYHEVHPQAYGDIIRAKHPNDLFRGVKAELQDMKRGVNVGGGFWSSIKNAAKTVWNGTKKVAKKVFKVGKHVVGDNIGDVAKNSYNMVNAYKKEGLTGALKEAGSRVAPSVGNLNKLDFSEDHNSLTAADRDYMKLTHAAYETDNEKRLQIGGWNLDKELSNRDKAVYQKDGEVHIAYRGSDFSFKDKLKSAGDVLADIGIARGHEQDSIRQKEMARQTDAVWDKYKTQNISMSGHSLGGTTGILNAMRYSNDSRFKGMTAYNPGLSPFMGKNLKDYVSNEKIRYIVKGGDPVSNSILKEANNVKNGTFLMRGMKKSLSANHSINDLLGIEDKNTGGSLFVGGYQPPHEIKRVIDAHPRGMSVYNHKEHRVGGYISPLTIAHQHFGDIGVRHGINQMERHSGGSLNVGGMMKSSKSDREARLRDIAARNRKIDYPRRKGVEIRQQLAGMGIHPNPNRTPLPLNHYEMNYDGAHELLQKLKDIGAPLTYYDGQQYHPRYPKNEWNRRVTQHYWGDDTGSDMELGD